MPTPNMSDEELDSLFQRGAEAYPDDNYLAAWERMETKLNTVDKAQLLRQKVKRLFAAEIMVFSLLLWQGYELTRSVTATEPLPPTTSVQAKLANRPLNLRTATGAPITKKNASSEAVVANYSSKESGSIDTINPLVHSPQPLAGQPVGGGSPAVAPASAPIIAPAAAPASTSPGNSAISRVAPARGLLSTTGVAPARGLLSTTGVATPQRRHAATSSSTPYAFEQTQRHAHSTAIQKTQVMGPVGLKKTVASANDKRSREKQGKAVRFKSTVANASATDPTELLPALTRTHTLKREKIDSLSLHNVTLATGALASPLPEAPTLLPTHRPTDSTDTKKRPAVRPAYRVVVGLLGAPAASAVRTAQSARLGGDIGLTLEYRFTNRLRVRTGLISSQKRYEAPSTDYTVPAAWQWFSSDYEVDGSCRITEIPIDLRYDVLSRPMYQVFASVGLNSLFMRDERYSYDWMQNGQISTREAHVVNGSHHILSVLNFSAGVERKLGARWSGQVEPFLQLPLGGVGAGQVRLSSLGAAFSLKFGLFR
jgi:hypothetical protein